LKVTIEPTISPNIWHFSTAPELRVYALQDFFTDEGVPILRGTPGTDEPHLKLQCTLQGATALEIPELEIDPSIISDRRIPYTAIFQTHGRKVPFLSNFIVPPEPSDTTWYGLQLFQRLGRMRFVNPPMADIQMMMASMIADALTYLRFASETRAGMAAGTYAPLDPLFPVHVSATDPLWGNIANGVGLAVAAGQATIPDDGTGTVTVLTPSVNDTQVIQAFSMDANVTGALHVENIVEDTSFDIVSNDGGDNGLMGWTIFNAS
jgi:hypothetical protein